MGSLITKTGTRTSAASIRLRRGISVLELPVNAKAAVAPKCHGQSRHNGSPLLRQPPAALFDMRADGNLMHPAYTTRDETEMLNSSGQSCSVAGQPGPEHSAAQQLARRTDKGGASDIFVIAGVHSDDHQRR